MADLTLIFYKPGQDNLVWYQEVSPAQIADLPRFVFADLPPSAAPGWPDLSPAERRQLDTAALAESVLKAIGRLTALGPQAHDRLSPAHRIRQSAAISWYLIWHARPDDPPERVALRGQLQRRCGHDPCTVWFRDLGDDLFDIDVQWRRYVRDPGLGDGAHRWRY